MSLIETKSLLAKLMATENLTVEQRNVPTASFDVKTRVLTVPILDKNVSAYTYDLFLGHEVGHALYTPLDGMVKAWEDKAPMSIVNVVEDSRIERKVKNKYPGIRSSFVRAYKELIDKDFFGTAGLDLNDLNFIDRINLYTKGGPAQGINFNDIEKNLLDQVENTQTYEQVVEVAKLIAAYMKAQEEEQRKNQALVPDDDGDIEAETLGESYDDFDDESDDGEMEQTESQESDESGDTEEVQDSDGDEPQDSDSGDQTGLKGAEQGDEPRSFTDEAYKKNESKLFSSENKSYYYGNIPDIDLENAVVTYKKLWNRYKQDAQDMRNRGYGSVREIDVKKFQKLRMDSKNVVGYLAKEFELRKNADQLKRAATAKTGEIDMSKIYAYQLTDDIFKKVTVTPNGKSHGLVMFLDWSGSMHRHLENTIKQLINLAMFCKKVNIPYEVYAFTSEYDDLYNKNIPIEGNINTRGFKLLNILSSKMSAAEYSYACSALVQVATYRGFRPHWFQLGGTPLNEAVISAMKIVPEFQKKNRLQIVNTVFLTDGEGHSLCDVFYTADNGRLVTGTTNKEVRYGSDDWKVKREFVIRDPKTRHEEVCSEMRSRELTNSYIKMLKAKTNCNIVGFYVLSGRELGRELWHFYPTASQQAYDKFKSNFRKNKSMVISNSGYDAYYLLRAEGLDTDDDVEFEVKENATTRNLVSAFSKYAGNRLSNRVVLNSFIGMIS